MYPVVRRLLSCLLMAPLPLMLPGNASFVAQQNPDVPRESSCAGAACDVTGEKNRSKVDEVESNAAGALVQLEHYSNSINPIFLPHAFTGATLQLGKEDLLFEFDEHHNHGIAIAGQAGSGNGVPGGSNVQGGGHFRHSLLISGQGGLPNAGSGRGNVQSGAPRKSVNGGSDVTPSVQPPQHQNPYSDRQDERVRLSDQGNKPVDTAPGIGPGETPGNYDPPTTSYTSPEELLADYVEPEFPLRLPETDGGNDVPSGNVSTTVPVPATLVLFALGLAACGVARRAPPGVTSPR